MNPYDVLGVSPAASDEEVARAYKTLAKRFHPDLNPDNADAVRRMGEINRAYDDIKSQRQQGYTGGSEQKGYYGGAYDPYYAAWQSSRRSYRRRPARSPLSMMFAAVMMFFLVRLLLSVLFGGAGGSYYVNPQRSGYGVYAPGYGYYDTITP